VRILIFHGYLLRGTGSNVYNASIASALVQAGHRVELLCQERDPFGLEWVDAAGDWDGGELDVRIRHEPVRATVYRPDIGGLLPVYVADRYAGLEARPFPDCSDAEVEHYVAANVSAVREVVALAQPDLALANHLVMGPAILARALAGTAVPFAAKVHGSALEYTVKPNRRFLPWAREGMQAARTVLVGSRHTAQSLWAALGDSTLPPKTRLGPPGVDLARFRLRSREEAVGALVGLRARLAQSARRPASDSGAGRDVDSSVGRDVDSGVRRDGDAGADSTFAADPIEAAAALADLDPDRGPLVAFVGKLIAAKGIDLLLAAFPLVLAQAPSTQLVVVGFGAFRAAAEGIVDALGGGDLEGAHAAAQQGAGQRMSQLEAFLVALTGAERARYLVAASAMREQVRFSGRLEHAELAELLPACTALVVPSTFPEAFGMVAAEAAACGALPISAAHSGLAEVTRELEAAVATDQRDLLSFALGPGSVQALANRLVRWLEMDPRRREATRTALAATAARRYGWSAVAEGVIAAAEGRLDALPTAV